MSLTHLPDNIASDEAVAHFILSKSEINVLKAQVKARALEPSRKDNAISVCRILDLNDKEIWEWGRQNVLVREDQTLHARADMIVLDITSLNLSIRSDEPPPRHANVFNWPLQKDAAMAVAQELAARSTLRIPES